MKIASTKDLGQLIRQKRKEDGVTLRDAAKLCNVGYVFLSELENGKPSVRLDKVLQVIDSLGIELYGESKGAHHAPDPAIDAPATARAGNAPIPPATRTARREPSAANATPRASLNRPLRHLRETATAPLDGEGLAMLLEIESLIVSHPDNDHSGFEIVFGPTQNTGSGSVGPGDERGKAKDPRDDE